MPRHWRDEEHWVAYAPTAPASSSPVVVSTAPLAQEYRDIGWEVHGPFMLAEDCSDRLDP